MTESINTKFENYLKALKNDIIITGKAIKSEKIYEKKIILLMELFIKAESLGNFRYLDKLKLSEPLIEFQNDFDNCDPRSFDYLIDRLSKGSYKIEN